MKETDIVQALRCCAEGECKDCAIHEDKQRCQENLLDKAAEAIERLTAENAALREKQRWIPVTERMPEEIKAQFTEDTMINLAAQVLGVEPSRIRELAEADKDGRVVVLPCNGYSDIDIVRNGISYKPDHWNIHLTAFAHGQNTPSGLKVGLFDIGEVERAMEEMEGKKDG